MANTVSGSEGEWTEIISPKKGILDINIAELWRYRDLIMLFVKRDFVSVYKQTILGPLWLIIQPVFYNTYFHGRVYPSG
jgi:lipopolysaccharide transport system permease protein